MTKRTTQSVPAEAPQIVLRRLDGLVGYARNSRTHSAAQIAQLKALIVEFGFVGAIAVDDKSIVAGHGRTLAMTELNNAGITVRYPNGAPVPDGMIPTVDCTGWSDAQRRAFVIADNKSALNAGWDMDMLRVELGDLKDMGFDLGLTGFDVGEISVVLDPEEAAPDDGIEDPPDDKYQEQFGVIVICGDEAEQQAMFERLQGEGLTVKVVTT